MSSLKELYYGLSSASRSTLELVLLPHSQRFLEKYWRLQEASAAGVRYDSRVLLVAMIFEVLQRHSLLGAEQEKEFLEAFFSDRLVSRSAGKALEKLVFHRGVLVFGSLELLKRLSPQGDCPYWWEEPLWQAVTRRVSSFVSRWKQQMNIADSGSPSVAPVMISSGDISWCSAFLEWSALSPQLARREKVAGVLARSELAPLYADWVALFEAICFQPATAATLEALAEITPKSLAEVQETWVEAIFVHCENLLQNDPSPALRANVATLIDTWGRLILEAVEAGQAYSRLYAWVYRLNPSLRETMLTRLRKGSASLSTAILQTELMNLNPHCPLVSELFLSNTNPQLVVSVRPEPEFIEVLLKSKGDDPQWCESLLMAIATLASFQVNERILNWLSAVNYSALRIPPPVLLRLRELFNGKPCGELDHALRNYPEARLVVAVDALLESLNIQG